MGYWQSAKQVTVPNGQSVSVVMPASDIRNRMTVWAISGARPLTNMTFQPQINGQNYGSSSTVSSAVAAKVIFSSGGAASENNLLPFTPPNAVAQLSANLDPFAFSVLVTNNGSVPEIVTLYAVALTPD